MNFHFLAQATNVAAHPGFFEKLKIIFPNWIEVLIFFALIAAGIAAGKILKCAAIAILRRLRKNFAPTAIAVESFVRALPVISIGIGIFIFREMRFATFADSEQAAIALVDQILQLLAAIALTQILWNFVRFPVCLLQRYAARGKRKFALGTLIPLIGAVLQGAVVLWGILLVVRVMTDTRPAEILAMLGIGGLALSLASQDSVKNFFGTAMLVVDRPFAVGDLIDIGTGTLGTVVRIGLRSTRIRTPDDHEICIPNADLANRVITKISAREKIRRTMNIGLTYDTPPEKVEEAVAIVSAILNGSGKLAAGTTASVFFSDFTDSTLNIRAIYAYAEPDVPAANAFAQHVNLEILRRFNAAGIAFAFPTQTVELKR